jgi:hypothetical protein
MQALARQQGWSFSASNNEHGLAIAVEHALGI